MSAGTGATIFDMEGIGAEFVYLKLSENGRFRRDEDGACLNNAKNRAKPVAHPCRSMIGP